MGCNCIPNGTFKVSNITQAAADPIQKNIEPHIKLAAEELCTWAKPTTGDTGDSWEKAIWKAALVAVALLNSGMQMYIADQRYKLAKDYANLASDRWSRFKDYYAPFERTMLSEAGNAGEYMPNYTAARDRGRENAQLAFRWADGQMADIGKKYALCVDPSLLNDMDYAEALSRDDGGNFNYRDEEYWHYYISDRRWNRRSQLLNLGRDLSAQAVTYAQAANDALKTFGGMLESGAQGAMRLFGYLSTVQETQYPAQFSSASPLTGQAGNLGSMLMMGPMAG